MVRSITLVAALVGASLALALPAGAASNATAVTVTAGKPTEFHFILSKKSVAPGVVTFSVTNKGKITHDFRVSGKKTTLIKPGKTVRLTLTLKAGKAAYLCTLPGHAAAGMKGTLTVR